MSTPKTTIRCAQCNKILTDAEQPCPSCGSEKKLHDIGVELEAPTTMRGPDLGLVVEDRTGFKKIIVSLKHKISGESKRPAREFLMFDRTDPNFTKKIHHVEEANETGKNKEVHHEEPHFPAKHRPKT
jgi:phage FluMu protein Com